MAETTPLPVVLVILDGWGHNPDIKGNAIRAAAPRFIESLGRLYPHGLLEASGEAVGLPAGFIGNSEVGHLALGAGRIVLQDLARINRAIRTGEFDRNPALLEAADRGARPGAALHLMGLLSDGGVHSHIDHLAALVRLARLRGVVNLFVHAFLDGRDTPPRSGLPYVRRTEEILSSEGIGAIATVSGRYYAMDRDNRWERIGKAYRALARGEAPRFATAGAAVEAAYAQEVGDEFIIPAIIEAPRPGGAKSAPGAPGSPSKRDGVIRDGDSVIFWNYRADRARQITRALTEQKFDKFGRGDPPALASFVCFTAYDRTWSLPVGFPDKALSGTFGQAVSDAGIPQLRIAETEKYAHVTYFFNGGVEAPFPGEARCLVPSPKVATYDLKPEMMAGEVTREVLARLVERPGQVVILNFANADMVGHTGFFDATVSACRTVDRSVEAVVTETLRLGGFAIVTADHGNAEQMIDPRTGGPMTAHTMNPVPVYVAGRGLEGRRMREGGLLADVAPTLIEILGIPKPKEMEGRSLLQG